jgi:hypothetical protein
MFSKISRYRKVPNVVTVDVQGRLLEAKAVRLLPNVTGTFLHTVTASDRLDQLGYKYYDQPRKWWHICDANPQFLSPRALLGQDATVTARFLLTVPGGGAPPWAALFLALHAVLGIEDVRVEEDVVLVAHKQTIGGQQVTVFLEEYARAVLVTYNRLNTSEASLASIIAAQGFNPVQPVADGQLGQQIVIPPDVIA